jgi:hypothetical protein
MAEGCRKCGGYVPPPALGKGGRPRVYCVDCSPPGQRDRWARPATPYPVLAIPAEVAEAVVPARPEPVREPVDLAARRKRPVPVVQPDADPDPSPAGPGALVLSATQKALDEAQATDTAEGALALHLAQLIAAGGYTANGAAALAKALREAMAEALKARPTADALDELVKKRRDRLRGTGTG